MTKIRKNQTIKFDLYMFKEMKKAKQDEYEHE